MADELFQTAPEEVLRYFRAKRSVPSFDWRDVAPEEHAFSWTVAKSIEQGVLEDIHGAVDDAIANRVPFEEFRARLEPVLREKGWWGRRMQTDPKDGLPKAVQLGSPRRLRTIYWANVRSAHAAGEWERTQRTKRFLPYLVYTLSSAERRRQEHEGWVGTVLPVDHPWWSTHYPPNGWGCKCGVRQISGPEARRLGYGDDTTAPDVDLRPWRNTRTGQTVMVPAGIDPGWQQNPGLNRGRNVSRFLFDQVDALPAHRRQAAVDDIAASPLIRAYAERRLPADSFIPVAQLGQAIVDAFGARTRLVNLSAHSVSHILHDHPDRALTVADLRTAIGVLAFPSYVVLTDRSAIVYGVAAGQWWRVVAKSANQKREWWLSSFHRKDAASVRRAIAAAERRGGLVPE